MKVAAVVVSHGHARELEMSLPALREQVDELVVIANIPGSVPDGVEAVHNAQPLGFGANVNYGAAGARDEAGYAARPFRRSSGTCAATAATCRRDTPCAARRCRSVDARP